MLALILIGVAVALVVIAVVLKMKSGGGSGKADAKATEKKAPETLLNYGEVNIYFGSQTGTATNFSRILSNEAKSHGFDANVIDLLDFKPEEFVPKDEKAFSIFVLATHYEGLPTDNAVNFYKWLTDEHPADHLSNLRFVVFGLGNHQYQFFNAIGRKANERLEQMGAQRIFPYGEGDDDVVIEDDFNDWKKNLWTEVKKVIEPQGERKVVEAKEGLKVQFNVTLKEDGETQCPDLKDKATCEGILKGATDFEFMTRQWISGVEVPVTACKELRQTSEYGSTLHLELDLTNSGLTYEAAQNCLIFAENSQDRVESFANYLGLKLDQVFELKGNEEIVKKGKKLRFPFPSPITVQTFLKHFCDLQGLFKKNYLKKLTEVVKDEVLKKKIELLTSKEGNAEYESSIQKEHKSIIEVLQDLKVKLKLEELVELSSRIAPRYYTIASSAVAHPQSLHLGISLVQTPLTGGPWEGLVSKQLRTLKKDFDAGKPTKLRILVNPSGFTLPEDNGTPAIMIGPGTGVVPFRAFLQEKEKQLKTGEGASKFGPVHLFFGCRKQESDYIYRDELEGWAKSDMINKLFKAFSREGKKQYVQHLLKEEAEELTKLIIEQRASVYVCGGTSMGKDVRVLIEQLLESKLGPTDGAKFFKDMEAKHKFVVELWG